MAYALVGSVGTVNSGTSGGTFTPSFGTGESLTSGHLLVALIWQGATLTSTQPTTTTTGWSRSSSVAAGMAASIFWGIAGTATAAPVIAAVSGITWQGYCAEFSGNLTASPVDQAIGANGTTSPLVDTMPSADAAAGELFIWVSTALYTAAATKTTSNTLNNGITANEVNNDATSTLNHYRAGWGITTGNSAADQTSFSFTTTKISTAVIAGTSFKLPAAAAVLPSTPNVISQAVNRSLTY